MNWRMASLITDLMVTFRLAQAALNSVFRFSGIPHTCRLVSLGMYVRLIGGTPMEQLLVLEFAVKHFVKYIVT